MRLATNRCPNSSGPHLGLQVSVWGAVLGAMASKATANSEIVLKTQLGGPGELHMEGNDETSMDL